jgi:adenylosuccinate synthase
MKAYTTRVGEGPFPSDFTDDNGVHMQTVGQEFGTTTGRQRRCGWFDGVMGLYSVMVNGLDSVALTKLDVLDDLDEVKICTGYRSTKTGELLSSFPATVEGLADIEAEYETLPGWGANVNGQQVQGAQTWDELPDNAKAMVLRLEEVLDCPISMVSVGPERDATIIRDPQFAGVAKQPAAV